MSDKFVTVATFNQTFEAQLAKNLLANEGIEAMLAGEQMADLMFAPASLGDQVTLQVREDDAQRAAGILAVAAAEARLDEDWENQAEAGVWTCSICGEPISNRLSICHSCQTPREGIRGALPPQRTDVQRQPNRVTDVQSQRNPPQPIDEAREKITPAAPPPEPADSTEDEREEPGEGHPTADDCARRAFWGAACAIVFVPILLLSWYYLIQLLSCPDRLSPTGKRHLVWAILLNGPPLLFGGVFCCGGMLLLMSG